MTTQAEHARIVVEHRQRVQRIVCRLREQARLDRFRRIVWRLNNPPAQDTTAAHDSGPVNT